MATDETLSQDLSALLRYKATRRGILVTEEGFANIQDVAEHVNRSVEEVRACARTSHKRGERRFELQNFQGCEMIRATRKRKIQGPKPQMPDPFAKDRWSSPRGRHTAPPPPSEPPTSHGSPRLGGGSNGDSIPPPPLAPPPLDPPPNVRPAADTGQSGVLSAVAERLRNEAWGEDRTDGVEKAESDEDIIKVLQEALDKKSAAIKEKDAAIRDKDATILELREELAKVKTELQAQRSITQPEVPEASRVETQSQATAEDASAGYFSIPPPSECGSTAVGAPSTTEEMPEDDAVRASETPTIEDAEVRASGTPTTEDAVDQAPVESQCLYMVKGDFDGRHFGSDYLVLRKGDTVAAIGPADDDGWQQGVIKVGREGAQCSGQPGWMPANYLEEIPAGVAS